MLFQVAVTLLVTAVQVVSFNWCQQTSVVPAYRSSHLAKWQLHHHVAISPPFSEKPEQGPRLSTSDSVISHHAFGRQLLSSILLALVAASPFVPSKVDAAVPTNLESGPNARAMVAQGMVAYRAGDLRSSLALFNGALAKAPNMGEQLWQRGLALYDTGDFASCSAQFRRDVLRNPADSEERVWAMLCDARQSGIDIKSAVAQARSHTQANGNDNANVVYEAAADPRPYMALVQDVFAGKVTPEAARVLAANYSPSSAGYFYVHLYLSLYFDADATAAAAVGTGNSDAHRYLQGLARDCIAKAMGSAYALSSGDYMVSVGRYQQIRLMETAQMSDRR